MVLGTYQQQIFIRFLIKQLRSLMEALMRPSVLQEHLQNMGWFGGYGLHNMAAAAIAFKADGQDFVHS